MVEDKLSEAILLGMIGAGSTAIVDEIDGEIAVTEE